MPAERINELFEKLDGRIGHPVSCPICGQAKWGLLIDTVVTLLAGTHDGLRRANDVPGTPPRSEGEDDDHWPLFSVAACCQTCGFLRLHLVQAEALLGDAAP